jgi:hypothetical protein
MGEALIVEVTDPRGRVQQRIRLGAAPITIGRALRNAVIIDDPYLDGSHLTVETAADGVPRFRDHGTVNGTWDGRHHRTAGGEVHAGLELKIGRTILRFVSADGPVPPALYDPTGQTGLVGRLLAPKAAVLVIGGYAVWSAWLQFLGSSTDPSVSDLVTPGLASLLLAAIWATMWAFTNRIVAQRFRFLTHLAWTVAIATAMMAVGIAVEWLGFFVPAADFGLAEATALMALAAWLLAGHFQLVTEWPRRRRWTIAAGVTGVVVVVIGVLGRGGSLERSPMGRQAGALKPIAGRFLPGSSVDDYFKRAESLKREVDALADEGRKAEAPPADSTEGASR